MGEQRLGLALSGGGFRASFFHIGVLARMAELNLLRDVESISTVSGGSIIGALYYLRLKELLENKPDAEIHQHHYVELVQQIEDEFTAAVKKNFSWYTFSSFFHNLKMMSPSYSRSDRIGELYDELIYRPAWKGRNAPIMMHELKIRPKDASPNEEFNPTRGHNDDRINKVPVLNINATVLNTGHDWRFTASRMGEVIHDDNIALNIDKNTRLEGNRYQALHHYSQGFPLGKAVAASACVPGLFPPLSISHMYGKPWRVQLVDGGVYDNQGIEALRDKHHFCTHMIISDASAQMRDEASPSTRTLPVYTRVSEVLMGRVREEILEQTIRENSPKSIALVHMTDGLPVTFKHHQDSMGNERDNTKTQVPDPTPEIAPNTRKRISRIRTDLDSFTDVESTSITAMGYLFANVHVDEFYRHWSPTQNPAQNAQWKFNAVKTWLKNPDQAPSNYQKQLEVAEQKYFKPYHLGFTQELTTATTIFSASMIIMLAILWVITTHAIGNPIDLLKEVNGLTILGLVLIFVIINLLGRLGTVISTLSIATRFHQLMLKVIVEVALPVLATLPVKVYLLTIDKYFLQTGEIKKKNAKNL